MSIFAANFILLKKIAEGGMAEIFLARQTGAGKFSKIVVLKKVFAKLADSPEFREMFQTEAALCSLMHHPNVVDVYSSGYSDQHLYMSMEYIPGLSLKELICKTTNENKKLATPILLHIVQQVAAGLDYIHRLKDPETQAPLGLIHRDISPQNIMISFRGEIKLIDFGIAKVSSTHTNETQNGVIKGNFAYMAPQQARGEALSPLTDIYSLGVVMYEAITGQRPFTGENPIEFLRAIDQAVFDKPSKITENVDVFLEQLVLRMMSYDQVHRPSASVLHDMIQNELSTKYPKFNANEFTKAIRSAFKENLDSDQQRISKLLKQSADQVDAIGLNEENDDSRAGARTQVSRNIALNDLELLEPPSPIPNLSSVSTRSTLSQLASTSHWKNDSQVVAQRQAEARMYQHRARQLGWFKRIAKVLVIAGILYAAHTYMPVEIQAQIAAQVGNLMQTAERSIASYLK